MSSGRRARTATGGMTLLELLLVMSLLGMLLGLGVGVLARVDLGRRAAVGLVQNVVRAARNSAIARGAPARVRLDPESNTLRAEASQVVGTWHFEAGLTGAFGLEGTAVGARATDAGWIGRGLAVDGARGELARFEVQGDSSFDLAQGFTLELALRLDDAGSGALLDLGGAAGLESAGGGALRGWLVPEVVSSTGERRPGGKVYVQTPAGALEPGRWHRVRFEHDRRLMRIAVDGVELAREPSEAVVWHLEGPLVIGSERRAPGFTVDALVIAAVAADEVVELPRSVRLPADAPRELRFDAGGALDREVHAEAVAIPLEHEDGSRALVRVHLQGTVE